MIPRNVSSVVIKALILYSLSIFPLVAGCAKFTTAKGPSITTTWKGSFGQGYSFRDHQRVEQIIIRVTNTTSHQCLYSLSASPGNSQTYDPRKLKHGTFELPYYLKNNPLTGAVIKDNKSADNSENSRVRGVLNPHQDGQIILYWQVKEGVFLPWNSQAYEDKVELTLESSETVPFPDPAPMSLLLTLKAMVRSEVWLSFNKEPSNYFQKGLARARVDFGNLEHPTPGNIPMFIKSNRPYTITYSSHNKGALVRESGKVIPAPVREEDKVPYRVKMDNRELNLNKDSYTTPVQIIDYQENQTYRRYNLSFEVDAIDPFKKQAGVYKDYILITIEGK